MLVAAPCSGFHHLFRIAAMPALSFRPDEHPPTAWQQAAAGRWRNGMHGMAAFGVACSDDAAAADFADRLHSLVTPAQSAHFRATLMPADSTPLSSILPLSPPLPLMPPRRFAIDAFDTPFIISASLRFHTAIDTGFDLRCAFSSSVQVFVRWRQLSIF